MIRQENGRHVIACSFCAARLDLGPAARPLERIRMPTGWFATGANEHACPTCSPSRTRVAR